MTVNMQLVVVFHHSSCCIIIIFFFSFIYYVALNVYMSLGVLRYEIKALLLLLAPPMYVVSAYPNHLLGHRHPCCWGLGALAYLYFACWFSWPTLPRWPMRVGKRYRNCEIGVPHLGSCVSAPVLLLAVKANEFGPPGLYIRCPLS